MAVQVEQLLARFGIQNGGAHRHSQGDVGRSGAVLVGAAAVFAIFAPMQTGVAEVDQCIDVAVGYSVNAAAASAVAAVRAALRYEFFAAKAGRAIAALAGNDFDGGFVDEFHGTAFCMM